MRERRNSDRIILANVWVREVSGDYFYSFRALNLSEEGIFLAQKRCTFDASPFPLLSFSLPDGKQQLRNLSSRIVRENVHGAAYEFLNLSEEVRMQLKRFLLSQGKNEDPRQSALL